MQAGCNADYRTSSRSQLQGASVERLRKLKKDLKGIGSEVVDSIRLDYGKTWRAFVRTAVKIRVL